MPAKDSAAEAEAPTTNAAEQRLLKSALSLFSEKGYEATSIREIIERAGVTRPVLYYYFVNKEDLFTRLVERCFADMSVAFNKIVDSHEGCRERLVALMWAGFDYVEHSPEVIRLILQIFFAPPQQGPKLDKNRLWSLRFNPMVKVMRDGLSSGELKGGDAETLAWVFCGIMDMHVMTKTNVPEAPLTKELAEGLVDIFMHGTSSEGIHHKPVKSPFSLEA